MALRPSSIPQRVVLPEPLASSLLHVHDPESDLARAANPTVTRLLATIVTDLDFEPTAAFALVTELVDSAARSRLDYVASLVTESESVCPPSIGGEPALSSDVFEDTQFELECLAVALPHFASMLLFHERDPDALDIPTPRSYAEAIMVSPPAFKARYVARGFSHRQGVDFFQTFPPTPKMTPLRVLLHVAAQRNYELHSLNFSTAFLQGSLHEEIWLRRPPGFTGSLPTGTQWSLCRPVYGLRQAPCEWHDTLRTTHVALRFAPSAHTSLFQRTDTSLPPFFILVYIDKLVFATADTDALALVKAELQERHTCTDLGPSTLQIPVLLATAHSSAYWPLALSSTFGPINKPNSPYPELVGCLMYLMTCTCFDLTYPLSLLVRFVAPSRHRKVHWDAAKRVLRCLSSTSGMGLVLGGRGSVVLTGHSDASWANDQVTQRSSQGYTFSLGSGSVLWRSARYSFVLGSNCEAGIYAGAVAAQELRWLTYLLSDLGERPRSPQVKYQRGQLRLSYVASRANTADVFTKALGSGDHLHFFTALGLLPT
ncbi:unnamed protein product [Closterium sp. NIES-53]